jgi:hypothetical protein
VARKLAATISPLALSPPRAAAAIDVGPDFFAEHVAPELRVVRRGAKRLYPIVELQRWLDENAEAPMARLADGRNG